MTRRRVGRLYHLEHFNLLASIPSTSASTYTPKFVISVCSTDRWHRRLDHLSSAHLKLLTSSGTLGTVLSRPLPTCMGCRLAKRMALQFSSSGSISVVSFDLVHYDIWGLASSSLGGF